MHTLMQQLLGARAWQQLAPALQAHHAAHGRDIGQMDIEYPRGMQPVLHLLRLFGVLTNRRAPDLVTEVEKSTHAGQQTWQRTLRYPARPPLYFNSAWHYAAPNQFIEWVNSWLGLQMQVQVIQGELHYHGLGLRLKLGRWQLTLPEWLALGHTTIREWALDEQRFAMDFRLTHPWFGQVFRYAGTFSARPHPFPSKEG